MRPTWTRRRVGRAATVGAAIALVLTVTACVPPSVSPDGSVPQQPLIGSNGINAEGAELWVADLFGGQLVRFNPTSGRVSRRWGPAEGLAAPDDLVVTPSGAVVYTSPGTGIVGIVPPGGRPRKLAVVGQGVNPIALDPSGDAVLVGFEKEGSRAALIRVPLDGSTPTEVASRLPQLNGFAVGPDGLVYAPSGGPAGVLGTGGVLRIDPATGVATPLALTFDEPGRRGFTFAASARFLPDGSLLVLQAVDPALFRVDVGTGSVTRFASLPSTFADNFVVASPELIYVTTFFGQVLKVDGAGNVAVVPVGRCC